jgi:hypothetical protein
MSAEESQSDLTTLIKQAEKMQIKLEMEVQFSKNMAFFQKKVPEIYNKLANFKPEFQSIYISDDAQIGLVNLKSKTHAYKIEPKKFAKQQVEHYFNAPTRFTMGFHKSTIVNQGHIHPIICNDAIDEYSTLELGNHYDRNAPLGLMVMIGCGLGYQIEEIANNYDIRNLFIYDSNQDSFYASLYVTDWESIAKKFNAKGGKIKINVGEDHTLALAKMRLLSSDIGFYNMVTTYVYKHTENTENNLFFSQLKKDFHIYGSSIGFFDDEQVAFSHTITNLNRKLPILNSKKPGFENEVPPLIIVGNGPSLDNLVDFLKQAQDHYVIMSCGSSLTSLYNLGIKPDIHVELERNLTVALMLEKGTSAEFTKDITLLALNNVAPATIDLFKDTYLAAKPNDNGTTILNKLIGKSNFTQLEMCNPTVTNCGLSYAINLGFKEIYLAGIDLGKRNEKQHHSKYSIWSQMDEKRENDSEYNEETLDDYTYSQNEMIVEGNFCDEIKTTTILNNSRRNMEVLLEFYPHINVINPNDGALIKGAKPVQPADLVINEVKDKSICLEKILTTKFTQFSIENISIEKIQNNYSHIFFNARKGLDLPETCDNINELMEHFNRIFKNLKAIEMVDETTVMLIQGSIQVHLALLFYFCSRMKKGEQFVESYKIGKKFYDRFLEEATHILKTEPLRLDDTGLLKETD